MTHPWESAIRLLQAHAAQRYQCYERKTSVGDHDVAKVEYDAYVELNTAAAFLREHMPSGVLGRPIEFREGAD